MQFEMKTPYRVTVELNGVVEQKIIEVTKDNAFAVWGRLLTQSGGYKKAKTGSGCILQGIEKALITKVTKMGFGPYGEFVTAKIADRRWKERIKRAEAAVETVEQIIKEVPNGTHQN